jgi:hypothetical protein
MTTNAFLFSWDQLGVESIVPIARYEKWDQHQLVEILASRQDSSEPNPLNVIINTMMLRARFNTHRHYEIYAIDCAEELDEEFWRNEWETSPQATADLIREKGVKLFSDRASADRIKII